MCRLVRKVAVGAVLVAGGLMVLSWAGLSSYPCAAWNKLKHTVENKVPLEMKVEKLRYQVSQLVPDMKNKLRTMAEMIVAVDNLRDEFKELHSNLDRQQSNILAMTRELDSGAAKVVFKDREYRADRLREKLASAFDTYKANEATLKSKEVQLDAKERELDAAREQVATIKAQKQELENQVALVEAELRNLRTAQARSKFHIDDTALGQAKATLAEIRNQLKVEKTATDLLSDFSHETAPAETKAKPTGDLTKEVKDYFGDTSRDAKVAEKK